MVSVSLCWQMHLYKWQSGNHPNQSGVTILTGNVENGLKNLKGTFGNSKGSNIVMIMAIFRAIQHSSLLLVSHSVMATHVETLTVCPRKREHIVNSGY